MYKQVYNFLSQNNIIYDLQFGFRQKFSTSHALTNLTENIRQALDEGYIHQSLKRLSDNRFSMIIGSE